MLLVLFLVKEYSYDTYHDKADRIYKLIDAEHNSSEIDYRVASILKKNYPEVTDASIINIIPNNMVVSYNNQGFNVDHIMSTDNAFFRMFSNHFINGNPSDPLPAPNSTILTERTAHKLFGSEDPIGKEIVMRRLGTDYPLTVTGVIEDFPENSSIVANMIVNMENDNFKFSVKIGDIQDSSTNRYLFNIFVELSKNSDPGIVLDKINSNPKIIYPYVKKAGLISLKQIYLYDSSTGSYTERGNPALLRLLMGIALIVLILALINYVNLSIAQEDKRNKEIGIRKTVGADRKDIVILYLTESVIVTGMAFSIAVLIIEIALPYFSKLIGISLSLEPLLYFPGNSYLFLSVLVISVIAGIWPALLFSSFSPVKVFKGSKLIASDNKDYFRNLLILFQFVVSITLLFCILVIQRQINFAENIDLGFNKEHLLSIDLSSLSSQKDQSRIEVLTNKLRTYQAIKSVTISNGVPGDVGMGMRLNMKSGFNGNAALIFADSNYVKTFDIQLAKGRTLEPADYGNVCYINVTAYNNLGWKNLNDKWFDFEEQNFGGKKGGYKVIGVVNDFYINSLYQPIKPTYIIFSSRMPPTNISLRTVGGTTAETVTYLQKVWKELFPGYPLNYQFYNDWFNQMYQNDRKLAYIIGLFTFIAMGISCLGILGMATLLSERRTKEIGIRKVHGASVRQLMVMLNKDFIRWILVAFLIACPLGWYAANRWLQDFAYHIKIHWWMFLTSGTIAVTIALLTISWQTWKASKMNPVESLRNE